MLKIKLFKKSGYRKRGRLLPGIPGNQASFFEKSDQQAVQTDGSTDQKNEQQPADEDNPAAEGQGGQQPIDKGAKPKGKHHRGDHFSDPQGKQAGGCFHLLRLFIFPDRCACAGKNRSAQGEHAHR